MIDSKEAASIRKALLRLSVYSVTLKALLKSTYGSAKALQVDAQVIDPKEATSIRKALYIFRLSFTLKA